MSPSTAWTFAITFLIFAASPGPDNITIVSRTMSHGPKSGVAYGLGVVTSIVMFVVLAEIGFGFISQYLSAQLGVIRILGAIYLFYIGVSMFFPKPIKTVNEVGSGSILKFFALGFFLNAGNPKMPLFYLALLPAAVGARRLAGEDIMLLIAIIVFVETLVIGAHVSLANKARLTLRNPGRLKILYRGAGILMIGAAILVVVVS